MKRILLSVIVVVISTSACLFVFELGLRVKHHELSLENYVARGWNLRSQGFPIEHDAELGWIPKSNQSAFDAATHTSMLLLDDGIRANGPNSLKQTSERWLATGASYVFGWEVQDDETWPAKLESKINAPILNAGVFGYGFDQIILRHEALTEIYHPKHAIIAIHPDNLFQTGMSQKFAKKPYFDIENNQLSLKNIPVPLTSRDLRQYQKIAGYSYLAHYLMKRIAPATWLDSRGAITIHNKTTEVNCMLLKRLEEHCNAHQMDCLVLLQYSDNTTPEAMGYVERLLPCAQKTELALLDLYPKLEAMRREAPEKHKSLYSFHMTALGNAWVAEQVYEKIISESLLKKGFQKAAREPNTKSSQLTRNMR